MHFPLSRKQFFLMFILFFLLLPAAFFLLSKTPSSTESEFYHEKMLKKAQNATSFSEFTYALFCHEVTSDSVTTAYSLKNPSSYKIPELSPTLSSFSYKEYAEEKREHSDTKLLSSFSEKLKTFSPAKLKDEEQFTYTLLSRHLSLNLKLSEYAYYDDLLGSTTGIQANLPVTLGEYPLRKKADIETYLSLLTQIPVYFKNVIAYEDHRKSLGFETPAFLLNATKDNLNTLLDGLREEDNSFTDTFDNRLASVKNLSAKERKTYQETNRAYVKKYVLPAYEDLLKYLNHSLASQTADTTEVSYSVNQKYLPEADTPYGLSSLPNGAAYYALLTARSTGSDRSMEELISMTEASLKQSLGTVLNTALTNEKTYLYYTDNPLKTPYHSPVAILDSLSLISRTDYPVLKAPPVYKIKSVSDSLAPSLSPAFYMVPAIDDYKNNTIYINPLYTSEENGNLFTTLAHEGFPGHLYQTVYFNEMAPHPIRHILDYPGYVEGWATYAEINSFRFIDNLKENNSLLKLYQTETLINLALCSRVDLGVNYENWTLNDVNAFFEENGFNSYYTAELYSYVVEAPSNYLSYFIGYLEIEDIKEQYKKQLMENYSEKEFHKRLLDIGPSDFSSLRAKMLEESKPTEPATGSFLRIHCNNKK